MIRKVMPFCPTCTREMTEEVGSFTPISYKVIFSWKAGFFKCRECNLVFTEKDSFNLYEEMTKDESSKTSGAKDSEDSNSR